MSLKALYEKFLAKPDSGLLSTDVALHYITTTTSFNGHDAVANHLIKQENIAKKKSEKILSTVEGPTSLCLDVELTLEFVVGGGAYLLTLDENFIVDRVVTFPLVHIVQFDNDNKISQIRLYWDQGSLLKQVEIIAGARGRNWPLRDGADQTRLIKASAQKQAELSFEDRHGRNNDRDEVVSTPDRAKSPTKDPHASLSLFDSLSLHDDPTSTPGPARGSARPPPRDYNELFGGEDADVTPTKSAKPVAPKGGISHRYKQSRIFDKDDGDSQPDPQTPMTLTSSKKYNHFEFGEAEVPTSTAKPTPAKSFFEFEEEETKPATRLTKQVSHFKLGDEDDNDDDPRPQPAPVKKDAKNMSQWDFEDFDAPAGDGKPQRKARGQEVRHFGWSDDENDLIDTPPKLPRAINPRRDAETHFKIKDEMTPLPAEKQAGRRAHSKGLGLYDNSLFDKPGDSPDTAYKPTGPSGLHWRKDFDSHWTMTDEPSPNGNAKADESKPISNDRMKAVKMMDSHWDVYDDDEDAPKQQAPATSTANKRASRDVNQPSWGFGDDDV